MPKMKVLLWMIGAPSQAGDGTTFLLVPSLLPSPLPLPLLLPSLLPLPLPDVGDGVEAPVEADDPELSLDVEPEDSLEEEPEPLSELPVEFDPDPEPVGTLAPGSPPFLAPALESVR